MFGFEQVVVLVVVVVVVVVVFVTIAATASPSFPLSRYQVDEKTK